MAKLTPEQQLAIRQGELPEQMIPEEVAAYFSISRPVVMEWIRAGEFPNAYKISGQLWRIPSEDVRAYARKLYGGSSTSRPTIQRGDTHA